MENRINPRRSELSYIKLISNKCCLISFLLLFLFTGGYASPANSFENNSITQQGITVKGFVRDTDRNPILMASVSVKGTTVGTYTEDDGSYTITIPVDVSNPVLIFSYIGYDIVEERVNNRRTIDVEMESNMTNLDEVVIVGYGVQRKVNLTGAVDQVTSKDIKDRPASNVAQMLQGKVPNLNITFAGGGAPVGTSTIQIRGRGSLDSGGNPLVLVDGVPGDLDRVAPSDIEAVSVLKDAAASAIYGARGAFGVILITTKSGKKGKTSISYSGNVGWLKPTVNTDYDTNGYESVVMNDDAFRRATGNTYTRYSEEDMAELEARRYDKTEHPDRPWVVIKPLASLGRDIYNYYGNYDWYHTIYRKVQKTQSHSINISGGSDKINYMLSGSYYQHNGIMRINQDKMKKYTFRGKIEAELFPFMKIRNNTNFFDREYSYPGREGDTNQNFYNTMFHALPAYAPQNPDGTATFKTLKNNYQIGDGQFAMLLDGNTKGKKAVRQFSTTTGLELTFFDNKLKLMGDYTFTYYQHDDWYRNAVAYYSIEPGKLEVVNNFNKDDFRKVMWSRPQHSFNAYFNYNDTFGKHHNIGITGGINYEDLRHYRLYGFKRDLVTTQQSDLSLGTGEMEASGGAFQWTLFGAFFRANYDYAGRYLLEVNGRYDGTSRFGSDDRWVFCPSASAGWRASEEKFFEPIKNVVNNLKIRLSYGTLGNQLPNGYSTSTVYPYLPTMPIRMDEWLVDGNRLQSVTAPNPVTADLTWEKVTTINGGLDINFLNNRLSFTGDIYLRKTTDMLVKGKTLPAVYGADFPRENAADLETKGFELSLRWEDRFQLKGKTFNYGVTVGLGDALSKVTKYDNPTKLLQIDNGNKQLSNFYEGQTLGEIWGYRVEGLFKTDEEAANYKVNQRRVNSRILKAPGDEGKLRAGDVKFIDLNGDDEISPGLSTVDNPGDMVIIGNTTPRYNYTFSLSADWNGIDVSAFFQGIGKRDWYPGTEADKFWGPYSRPYITALPANFRDDIWSEDNPNAYLPRLRAYTALDSNCELSVANDRYLQSLAYLRLKNLVVGYTLPARWTKHIGVNRCRVYLSGENLFTWTSLTDYIDPEAANVSNHARVYPLSKVFSFGIDITF